MLFPMLLGMCMTMVDAGRDMWTYNADANAQAFANSLALQVICRVEDLCGGEPLRCTLITTYTTDPLICSDNFEFSYVDVPVATIECSNIINCSPFVYYTEFDSLLNPSDCCQVIA